MMHPLRKNDEPKVKVAAKAENGLVAIVGLVIILVSVLLIRGALSGI